MKLPIVLVVCNALDDNTRLQRRINTDSPAASRKVFQMCQALRQAGVRPYVLSLGRGRPDNSGDVFSALVRRVHGIPTIYAPFSHRRGFSELLSLFGLLAPLRRLARFPQKAVIFYNRTPAYLPALHEAVRLGYRCYLDLEDGEVGTNVYSLKKRILNLATAQFDRLCKDGVLLACSALSSMTRIKPTYCYYGTAVGNTKAVRWKSPYVSCLMSGTLSLDTGAQLLIDAIRLLRQQQPTWATELRFVVTGKGSSLSALEQLVSEPGFPLVQVHGRTTDVRYTEILSDCDVGLALKPVGGALADTTFPSKVIEFASSRLLVLSTDISDVRQLLGEGARYLESNDPELLVRRLEEIVKDREEAASCAQLGNVAVERRCAPVRAGRELHNFLFRNLI